MNVQLDVHLVEQRRSVCNRLIVSLDRFNNLACSDRLRRFLKLFLLGKNEECLGGREKPSILACAFEAFLGAIFLEYKELGLKAVYDFLIDNFENEILNSKLHNYKAILQEYTQGESHKLPVYKVLDEFGLSHDKTYIIGVYYNDILVSEGEGRSKKDAEQAAAKKALEFLKVEIV